MSRLTDRLRHDLADIADAAMPSPTAWAEIQRRVADDPGDTSTTVIRLTDDDGRAGSRRWMLRAAAVLALVIGTASLLVAVRDIDDDGDTPVVTSPATSPTTVPPATTAVTTPPTTATTIPPADEWSPEATPPGRYTTTLLEPAMTFALGDGWAPGQPPTRLSWEAFRRGDGIDPAAEAGIHVFREFELDTIDAVVDRATVNGFDLASADDVEIGGIPGRRYEIDAGAGTLVQLEFSEFGLDSSVTPARFTVLDVDGAVMVVVEVAGPDADPATARTFTQDVIDSMTWTTSD